MVCETCAFRTDRLDVRPWHSEVSEADLVRAVTRILTPAVTRALPPDWLGPFSEAQARLWIADRDAEGTMLLAREHAHGGPSGLLVLHEEPAPTGSRVEIRLGYVLAEAAWGKGLGQELISGFIDWCLKRPVIASLAGGVARENPRSARLLERLGFQAVDDGDRAQADEVLYRLRLHVQ